MLAAATALGTAALGTAALAAAALAAAAALGCSWEESVRVGPEDELVLLDDDGVPER